MPATTRSSDGQEKARSLAKLGFRQLRYTLPGGTARLSLSSTNTWNGCWAWPTATSSWNAAKPSGAATPPRWTQTVRCWIGTWGGAPHQRAGPSGTHRCLMRSRCLNSICRFAPHWRRQAPRTAHACLTNQASGVYAMREWDKL